MKTSFWKRQSKTHLLSRFPVYRIFFSSSVIVCLFMSKKLSHTGSFWQQKRYLNEKGPQELSTLKRDHTQTVFPCFFNGLLSRVISRTESTDGDSLMSFHLPLVNYVIIAMKWLLFLCVYVQASVRHSSWVVWSMGFWCNSFNTSCGL